LSWDDGKSGSIGWRTQGCTLLMLSLQQDEAPHAVALAFALVGN
jgi:hypothetical protein